MSKKNFQAASTSLVKELGDIQSGYFDHSHFIAVENKAFVKGFESRTSESASKPLNEAIRGSALAVESLDALDGSTEALKVASETLKSVASKMKETAEKETSFIDTRMATRAEREVQQEKEIEAFLELQKDERKRVEEEFEQKKAALYRIYAV